MSISLKLHSAYMHFVILICSKTKGQSKEKKFISRQKTLFVPTEYYHNIIVYTNIFLWFYISDTLPNDDVSKK